MAKKLPPNLYWKAFVGPEAKCDLSSMLKGIRSKDEAGEDQHLHVLSDLDQPPLPPPQIPMYNSIYACRHGIYENVFYNASGAPTHCVIHFPHRHRGKCLPVDDLIEVILKEAQLPYKVDKVDDNTIEYRRFILVVRSWMYGPKDAEHDAWRRHYWSQQKGLNSDAYRKLFFEPALLFDKTHLDPFVIKFSPKFENLKLGPRVFCDMALTHFPMRHKDIFGAVPPMRRRSNFKFPVGINMVYFRGPFDKPTDCYVPKEHYQLKDAKEKCLSFEDAQDMLSKKNNGNEELKDIKRRYLVAIELPVCS
uniref:Uncharacterized protein n=1 Tax=Romanomermis culicivorax TaxID=13658 RepID=A0A915JJ62_ROMCU